MHASSFCNIFFIDVYNYLITLFITINGTLPLAHAVIFVLKVDNVFESH